MKTFSTATLSVDAFIQVANKIIVPLLTVIVGSFGLAQNSFAIERGCKAAYVLVHPSTGGEIFFGGSENHGKGHNFTARGSCGNRSVADRCRIRARQTAQKCMDIHWDKRWDRERPEACSSGNRVDNYAVNDLKLHLERRACEKDWGRSSPVRVKLFRKTWGDSQCGSYVQISGYNMTPEMCRNSGR